MLTMDEGQGRGGLSRVGLCALLLGCVYVCAHLLIVPTAMYHKRRHRVSRTLCSRDGSYWSPRPIQWPDCFDYPDRFVHCTYSYTSSVCNVLH